MHIGLETIKYSYEVGTLASRFHPQANRKHLTAIGTT